jgi:hypothetical protein
MTGMVQPDVGPSAKYKENSVDDPDREMTKKDRNDIEVGNISQNL